ncbi:MAG: DUF2628 domain-containing protein [Oscillospiraceae bacterium]|nr:DUF2628 domain-containing protein [Oscillospiraceae bacterium]
MANYVGVRCPVCSKKFTQADDVVVCPVCGAPHHRHCYKLENKCAFEKEHITGKNWQAGDESGDGEIRSCHVCNIRVPKGALFCSVCGAKLTVSKEPPGRADENSGGGQTEKKPADNPYGWDFPGMEFMSDPSFSTYGGVDPEEEISGVPAKDLAKYIDANSGYYLPRFRHMFKTGGNISPNFAALFFGFFYYFYRKMYSAGFVLFGIYVLSVIPSFFYTREMYPLILQQSGFAALFESMGVGMASADSVNIAAAEYYGSISSVAQFIHFAAGALLSLFCNRLYMAHCIKEIGRIRPENLDPAAISVYEAALAKAGGTSKGFVLIAALAVVALYLIGSFVILYSSFY